MNITKIIDDLMKKLSKDDKLKIKKIKDEDIKFVKRELENVGNTKLKSMLLIIEGEKRDFSTMLSFYLGILSSIIAISSLLISLISLRANLKAYIQKNVMVLKESKFLIVFKEFMVPIGFKESMFLIILMLSVIFLFSMYMYICKHPKETNKNTNLICIEISIMELIEERNIKQSETQVILDINLK